MKSTFKVKVNSTIEHILNQEDLVKTDLIQTNSGKYHILDGTNSIAIEITNADFLKRHYTVKINNNTYTVEISDELDMLIEELGLSVGSSKHVNSIKAPMPGLLLDIHVKEGDEVKEDEALMILEAMKMENVIISPCDGVIKSVSVQKGAAIDKGQLLIEFE